MRNFFPNIETAVIFVFLLCIMLWGVSRCRKKKDDAAVRTATEAVVSPLDTLNSPAASRTASPVRPPVQSTLPPPTTINNAPVNPNYTLTTPQPPPTSPTLQPPPSQVPQQYNTPVAPQQTAVPMPNSAPVNSKSPTKSNTTIVMADNGAPLYVLINGLNVRAKPDLKAKSMGKLKLNDVVYFQNEKTDIPQAVRLADGTSITKPWFKIKTKRGTIGWVHGSGVDFYQRKPSEGL